MANSEMREDIRDVVDSVIFASSRIGSVIPMLFTPVPGSALYEEYRGYLFEEMGFDRQHLNCSRSWSSTEGAYRN